MIKAATVLQNEVQMCYENHQIYYIVLWVYYIFMQVKTLKFIQIYFSIVCNTLSIYLLKFCCNMATLLYYNNSTVQPSSSVFVYSMLFPFCLSVCLFCLVTDKKLSLICIKSISLRQLPAYRIPTPSLLYSLPAWLSCPFFLSCLCTLASRQHKNANFALGFKDERRTWPKSGRTVVSLSLSLFAYVTWHRAQKLLKYYYK